ncbi:MAG: OsmC family protein [Bacteroidetes bacterium]|nr:OsmC family protein [Bacteroidota bacterium]
MPTIHSIYKGDLRTEMEHLQSGQKIITDAPVDNQGKGEYFSPTDLVAAALGSCMITIMGIAVRTHGFSMEGVTWAITKVMTDNPRRIGEVIIDISFPRDYTDKEKAILEYCVKSCPVAKSLHPEVKQTVRLMYPTPSPLPYS